MNKTVEPKNLAWIEKYRPVDINDFIFNDKQKVVNILNNINESNHLIFHSLTPGTGKTSLAKLIIRYTKADALKINASEERGIDTVRNKITSFISTKSSNPDMKRIVFLDEGEHLTAEAQKAMLSIMEIYSVNAIFIICCNNIAKLSEALSERCERIYFGKPDKTAIFNRMKIICEAEQVEHDDDGLIELINKNYPKIRSCIKALQIHKRDNIFITQTTAKKVNDEFDKLWNLINVDKNRKAVTEYLFNNNIDIRSLNKDFWYKYVEEDNVKKIQITCSNMIRMNDTGEDLCIFITSLIDLVK